MASNRPKNQDLVAMFLSDPEFEKNLIYCRNWRTYHLYTDGHYETFNVDTLSQHIYRFIAARYPEINITTPFIDDLVKQCKMQCPRQYENVEQPYIGLTDKLFNTKTFELEEFDREKIAIHYLPFSSEEMDMPTPVFDNYLATTLVKPNESHDTDHGLINVIQEMLGYYLLPDLKAAVVFFLIGLGSNGKSIMVNIVERMVGHEFVSAMSLDMLTNDKFALASLIGKKVNICNEEESKYVRIEKLKVLTSGDPIQAQNKFERSFSFRPTTKYLFATNDMPTFDSYNYGVKRRLMLVPFNRTFLPSEKDHDLLDKLRAEMPGITAWALQGAKRLVDNKYVFSNSSAIEDSSIEFEGMVSSAIQFFREEGYTKHSEATISNDELYAEYRTWCDTQGRKPLNAFNFHKDITNNLGIKTTVEWRGGKAQRLKHVIKVTPPVSYESINSLFSDPPPKTYST